MTRPGRAPRDKALSSMFAADAQAAILRVLARAGTPLAASDVVRTLHAAGVAKSSAEKAWERLQPTIRSHDQVIVEGSGKGMRYRWADRASTMDAVTALQLLAGGKLAGPRRAALVAVIQDALHAGSDGSSVGGSGAGMSGANELEEAARRRQEKIDAVRGVADLASEVEELVADEVEPDVLIRRVRAWVKRSGLEPIERAGEHIAFNRKLHKPIGPSIRDGARVIVVRPGYIWKAPAEEVLLGKAIVEE